MLNDVVECIVRALEGADDNRVRHLATLFDLIITTLPCEDEIRGMLLKLPHVHGNTAEVQVRGSALAAACESYNASPQSLAEMLREAGDRTKFRRMGVSAFLRPLIGERRRSAATPALAEQTHIYLNTLMSEDRESEDAEMWGRDVRSLDIGRLWQE